MCSKAKQVIIDTVKTVLENKDSISERDKGIILPLLKNIIPAIISPEEIDSSRGLKTIQNGNDKFPFEVLEESTRQFNKED